MAVFLTIPLLFARCIPADFVNPFLPWRIAPAICVALLLAAVLVIARVFPAYQRTRLQALFARVITVGTLAVVIVAALLWGASLSFIAWCSPFDGRQLELQAQLAWAAPSLVYAIVGMTVVLLVAMGGVLVWRLCISRGGAREQSPG